MSNSQPEPQPEAEPEVQPEAEPEAEAEPEEEEESVEEDMSESSSDSKEPEHSVLVAEVAKAKEVAKPKPPAQDKVPDGTKLKNKDGKQIVLHKKPNGAVKPGAKRFARVKVVKSGFTMGCVKKISQRCAVLRTTNGCKELMRRLMMARANNVLIHAGHFTESRGARTVNANDIREAIRLTTNRDVYGCGR